MSDSENNQSDGGGKSGYQVLARKYRPQSLADLIGQEAMVRTLENAFSSGRIAQAYILTGVRGVGKTTTARILARALNYAKDGEDDAGPRIDFDTPGIHCAEIMESRHVDVLEMDAASRTGINDIREIIESVRYLPLSARYKVYIIDEVHMLSTQAFNGLLKTLEEPPEHVKFIFATTEIRKVPVTVLSRCQRFDLRRVDATVLADHFAGIAKQENADIDEGALAVIARAAEGSVRDGLSILDQAIAHGDGMVTADAVRAMLGLADRSRIIELFEAVVTGNVAGALDELKSQYDGGADPALVLSDLAAFTHFVTRVKYVPAAVEDPALSEAERVAGKKYADTLDLRFLARAWQALLKGLAEVRNAGAPLDAAEMVLIRLAHMSDLPTPDELIRTIRDNPAAAPDPAQSTAPSGNGATAQASTAPLTSPPPADIPERENPAPDAGPPAAARPQSFDEVIELARSNRELILKEALETQVRLVSFEPGRIEIDPVASAPRDLANRLSAALLDWTGQRWMIGIASGKGDMTISERDAIKREKLFADAREEPVVKAILEKFSGAEITDVRENRLAGDGPEKTQITDETKGVARS
jgi:DNA polymerase III subunit gamma/tau